MKKTILSTFAFLLLVFIIACSGAKSTTGGSANASCSISPGSCAATDPAPNGGTYTGADDNSLTVVAGNCGFSNNINLPCANVTICEPGTSNCQTISNILVDTGSYGLRIFKQAITSVTLDPVQVTISATTYNIGECALFGSGSDWGQLYYADLNLANEPTISNIPIQVIDSTFGTVPTICGTVDTSPADAGFNGIIGVGLSTNDCGTYCTTQANNLAYYKCNGSSCSGVALPATCDGTGTVACQIQNPVSSMQPDAGNSGLADNNGVVLEFAHVATTGATSLTGHLLFGIGTRANNTPGAVTTYTANSYNEFSTTYYGTNLTESFIDSGSNGLFFPSTPVCIPGCGNGFYCPSACTSYNLTATQVGANAASNAVTFQAYDLGSLSASNAVFSNVTGEFDSNTFDWGFPFFLGRTIYVGVEGGVSTLGTGPYWAY